jgi:hypothetical protein
LTGIDRVLIVDKSLRMRTRLTLPALVFVLALASVDAAPATYAPPQPPPPAIPPMPKGPTTRCTTTGPAWALWGIHTPNSPPLRGNRYLVQAWGIPCSKAKVLVRAFFPKIPPHSTGNLAGGPKGFRCKGLSNGLLKNRMYAGQCVRLKPATMFNWEPTVGKVT